MDWEFAQFVKAFIENPVGGLLLEDTGKWYPFPKGDPFEVAATRYNQELYWRISGPHLSVEDIAYLTGMPILPYPWCGFFHESAGVLGKAELTGDDLNDIVKALAGIAIGAFDHTSYVLWWKESRPLPSKRMLLNDAPCQIRRTQIRRNPMMPRS